MAKLPPENEAMVEVMAQQGHLPHLQICSETQQLQRITHKADWTVEEWEEGSSQSRGITTCLS